MKSILLTGCAGFIGSNFLPYFLERYPDCRVIHLDLLTYAGRLENIAECMDHPRHVFVQGDICNRELVGHLFRQYDLRGVIHFAAESHVDNSISHPERFIETNINGTHSVLHAAYQHWMSAPFVHKEGYDDARLLHISTDEVYGTLGEQGLFSEDTPYAPSSPYSASKAASDHIVRSYFHTYGMKVVITNCSNNYGPKQHKEKLIPTIIRKALSGQPIPIYGDGKNIRDWLYVRDHCKGIDLAFSRGQPGRTYNIGGRNERNNNTIAATICGILDRLRPGAQPYHQLIRYVADRAGHDRRYAIDASRIERELGWAADEHFDSGIEKTVRWYLEHPQWL